MKLWRRAAGALKDKHSIWISSLSRKTPYRHPDLQALIIKATSHDETSIDYKSAKRVFEWVRTSPIYLKPLAWALSSRMEKTRSWVVALKGLMLMHGVFCCRVPAVLRIGRLPFDLSDFSDGHSSVAKAWGYNAFVRAYYAYLDQKSAFLSSEVKKNRGHSSLVGEPLAEQLTRLQKWQALLDMLLQIKPQEETMKVGIIFEAMNNITIEIFDVYSRICNGIAHVLLRIYAAPGKREASMALDVVQKARVQAERLPLYFEACREMGVLNASDCPILEQIPEEDIRELEYIINGGSKVKNCDGEIEADGFRDRGAIVEVKDSKRDLETVITDKWEVFDEIIGSVKEDDSGFQNARKLINVTEVRPSEFEVPLHQKPHMLPCNPPLVLPDLISF